MQLISSEPDLETLVRRIADGSLDLQPEFQRGSVWSTTKQQLLVDSVLRSWYIPPIHVVRVADQTQLVLDGQQRLTAILDFCRDRLQVDGSTEPLSDEIKGLNGLTYSTLPLSFRRRFDRFTIRVFELTDYEPAEPYELFFRLNQSTSLTAAEKRNAFFGEPRTQIRSLTQHAIEVGMRPTSLGFSNNRLAYEDVIAKFICTLEAGSLNVQITAERITERYRDPRPFDSEIYEWCQSSLERVFGGLAERIVSGAKPNKAMAYSWLCHAARSSEPLSFGALDLPAFIAAVELARSVGDIGPLLELERDLELDLTRDLVRILADRASSRVNDVQSVLLRDIALSMLSSSCRSRVLEASLVHNVIESLTAARESGELSPDSLLSGLAKTWDWSALR